MATRHPTGKTYLQAAKQALFGSLENRQSIPTRPTTGQAPQVNTEPIQQRALQAIEANEQELQVCEIKDKYLIKATFSANSIEELRFKLRFIEDFEVFQPWLPAYKTTSEGTHLSLFLCTNNPQQIKAIIDNALLGSGIKSYLQIAPRAGVKIIEFENGYKVPIMPSHFMALTSYSNYESFKTNHPLVLPLNSANESTELPEGTHVATLRINLSNLSFQEIKELWASSDLASISKQHRSFTVTLDNQTGELLIADSAERGIDDLLILAANISEITKKATTHVNIVVVKESNTTHNQTTESVSSELYSGKYLTVIHKSLLRYMNSSRFMHTIKIETEDIPGSDFLGVTSLNRKMKLDAREIVGKPHQMCLEALYVSLSGIKRYKQVTLEGEAGMGKSNIIANLAQKYIETENAVFLSATLTSINSPLQSSGIRDFCIQILSQVREITKSKHRKSLTPDLIQYLTSIQAYLAETPEESRKNPQRAKEEIIRAIKTICEITQGSPVILVLEDRHFIDHDSSVHLTEVLRELEELQLANLRVIITQRPKHEYANPELHNEKDTLKVPAIPFYSTQNSISNSYFLNTSTEPVSPAISKIPNEINISEFVLKFIAIEYPDLTTDTKMLVEAQDFFRLLQLSRGNPNSAQQLIRIAISKNAIKVKHPNTLTIETSFLDKIEAIYTQSANTYNYNSTPDTATINSILIAQIADLSETQRRILGTVSLGGKIPLIETLATCERIMGINEQQFHLDIQELKRKGYISIFTENYADCLKLENQEIGLKSPLSPLYASLVAADLLRLEDKVISPTRRLQLLAQAISQFSSINEISIGYLEFIIELIDHCLINSPSTKLALQIYNIFKDVPSFKARIIELKNNGREERNSLNTELADKIILKVILAGLFGGTSNHDKTMTREIHENFTSLFANSQNELVEEYAQQYFETMLTNLYVQSEMETYEEIYSIYTQKYTDSKIIYAIYLAYKKQYKIININTSVIPKDLIPGEGMNGVEIALSIIQNLTDSKILELNEQEKNEIERLKLRIQYEIDRIDIESQADETLHSQEYYPLSEKTPEQLQASIDRLSKLNSLQSEAEKNPSSFYNSTRLDILELTALELLILLEDYNFKEDFKLGILNEQKHRQLLKLQRLLEDIANSAEISDNPFNAIRSLQLLAQLSWYQIHSLAGSLKLYSMQQKTEKEDTTIDYAGMFDLPLKYLKKAIDIAKYSRLADQTLHSILLDYITFVTISIKSYFEIYPDLTKVNPESITEILEELSITLSSTEVLVQNFGSKEDLNEHYAYEWGALGSLLEILEKLFNEPMLNFRQEHEIQNTDGNKFKIDIRQGIIRLKIQILEALSEDNIDTALTIYALEERVNQPIKNSPSRIGETLIEGLLRMKQLNSVPE